MTRCNFLMFTNYKCPWSRFSGKAPKIAVGHNPLPAWQFILFFQRNLPPKNQQQKTARGGLTRHSSCLAVLRISSPIYTQTLRFVGVHEVCKKRHNPQPLPAHQGWIELSHETNKQKMGYLLHITGWFMTGSFPWKIEWDLTNGPLSKVLEILDT